MALADRVYEAQEPCSETWSAEGALSRIQARVNELEGRVRKELEGQGFEKDRIKIEMLLNMRYDGTDTALMTLKPEKGWKFDKVFVDTYKQEVSSSDATSL